MLHVRHCGIDIDYLHNEINTEEFRKEYNKLKNLTKGKLVIGSSDNLSFLAGISEKLTGYKKFLERFSNYRGKTVLVQVNFFKNIAFDRNQGFKKRYYLRRGRENSG